ncbi:hypothetical protein Q7C18_02705 [Nesterenkonia sp. CL21]|uniref:hypothetical protein n=1 Tax=Nesterenkonia sp. CL21 TaxID=3064894 RepID=UPI0028791DA9|nr:hypothetical protein [Nesterenkonia sp. CL21]MDS2171599.1 hypothetical protein [Nesterenkonia sp. CL21]
MAALVATLMLVGCSGSDPVGFSDMTYPERQAWLHDLQHYESTAGMDDAELLSMRDLMPACGEDHDSVQGSWYSLLYGPPSYVAQSDIDEAGPEAMRGYRANMAVRMQVSVAHECPGEWGKLQDWLEHHDLDSL